MKKRDLCHKVILPCCSSFDSDRQIFNRTIQKYPFGIVYCESEGDVADGIQFARGCGLTVSVRSGGHNYEGFSVGDGILVLDTSRLKNRNICEENGTVCIGSGVNNKELYEFLGKYGYPFPSGTCPTVGAAGLTQGGGWGHSARIFGLACDSLLEAKLVDAGGNLIAACPNCHPDLFWAIRGGGGGNFGVVTSLKYRLPPRVSNATYVDIRYARISEKVAHRFFNAWQGWLSEDDTRFTPNSRIFNSKEEGCGIYLRGFYYGTPDEARKSVQPFLEIAGVQASFKYVTYGEAVKIDASFYPSSERFRFAGRFVRGDFTKDQIVNILRFVKTRAEGSNFASVALYALGGRVREIKPSNTAFFYRDADYIIGIETVWENPAAEPENLSWILPRFEYLQSITVGSYINFPYLCTDQYMKAYYGGNAERLMRVKRKYDPCNLFCFPQSIRMAR